jgi:hypothetical protein
MLQSPRRNRLHGLEWRLVVSYAYLSPDLSSKVKMRALFRQSALSWFQVSSSCECGQKNSRILIAMIVEYLCMARIKLSSCTDPEHSFVATYTLLSRISFERRSREIGHRMRNLNMQQFQQSYHSPSRA